MSEATARQIDIDDGELEDVSVNRERDAREWLRRFFKSEGLDKTGLARKLGLGKDGRNVVNKFLGDGGAEDGVSFARITLATERLRAQEDGPEGIAKDIGFRETRSFLAYQRHFFHVRDNHALGAIVGPYGAGKTESGRELARRARHDGKAPVRFVRCRVTMNLPALVRKLAIDMGIVERGGEPAALHEEIVRHLHGHPEFLIFDEADYLTYSERCLQFLRDLHDETGTGVLLTGQLYFLNYVWSRADFRANGRDDAVKQLKMAGALAPFADRLAVESIPGLDEEEIVDIAEDVLKMQLTEEASSKLAFYVDHNFRVLRQILLVMRDMRIRAGKSIDHKIVEAAWIKSRHIKARR